MCIRDRGGGQAARVPGVHGAAALRVGRRLPAPRPPGPQALLCLRSPLSSGGRKGKGAREV
eukprot:2040000-Rhodomonas_salina.1